MINEQKLEHADFIVDGGAELPDEDDGRRIQRRPLLSREDEQEDVEALERRIQARYARSSHTEYDEETTDVEQQAHLPSVRDPKLWMVKCAVWLSYSSINMLCLIAFLLVIFAGSNFLVNFCVFVHQIGREREAVICLMQKYIDKGTELQITSAVALDHLKNYIYIEAYKEAHVKEVIYV